MESFTFKGFDETELISSKFKWQGDHPDCRVIKTYPIESLPVHFYRPAYQFAPIPPAQPRCQMRIDFKPAK
jgi:hypothetical protein